MDDLRFRARRDELDLAARYVNTAHEEGAPYFTQLAAARYLHYVLSSTAADTEFWADVHREVTAAAAGQPPRPPGDAGWEPLREAVADLLSAQLAGILIRTGYRTPPPPPASVLVDLTRVAVVHLPADPALWGAQVEVARAALEQFADQVAARIPAAEHRDLVRILRQGRKVVTAAELVAQFGVMLATGNVDIHGLLETARRFADQPAPPVYEPPFAMALGATAALVSLEHTARSAGESLELPDGGH